MRNRLRRVFSTPVRESGRDYLRGVGRHWIALTIGVLSLVGGTQVVFAFSLPYWLWLLVGFLCLSWAQLLAYHDLRVERNEIADELRIGREGSRTLEGSLIALRERVRQRDLIVQFDHELRMIELLYHRTTADPVHPLTLMHVRQELEGMDRRVGIYLTPIDAEAATRFCGIPIENDLLVALHRKRKILQEFIDDPGFFESRQQWNGVGSVRVSVCASLASIVRSE